MTPAEQRRAEFGRIMVEVREFVHSCDHPPNQRMAYERVIFDVMSMAEDKWDNGAPMTEPQFGCHSSTLDDLLGIIVRRQRFGAVCDDEMKRARKEGKI